MNYDQARELSAEAGGGWRWTTMNDGHVRTAWPCRRLKAGEAIDLSQGIPPYDPEQWETCEPHATEEEATRHWYDASLAEVVEMHYEGWHGCQAHTGTRSDGSVEVCDVPTKVGLGNRGMGQAFSGNFLCDAHRTPEALVVLNPFRVGTQVIHS